MDGRYALSRAALDGEGGFDRIGMARSRHWPEAQVLLDPQGRPQGVARGEGALAVRSHNPGKVMENISEFDLNTTAVLIIITLPTIIAVLLPVIDFLNLMRKGF